MKDSLSILIAIIYHDCSSKPFNDVAIPPTVILILVLLIITISNTSGSESTEDVIARFVG